MKFREFIKEKILLILLVLFIITSSEILLLPYPQIEIFVRLYIAICPIIIISIDIIIEYRKKNNFYKELKNNLYKFETFIFDGFEYLDDMLVMRVNRDEEFAPIKNREGSDSPKTAVNLYNEYVKKYN